MKLQKIDKLRIQLVYFSIQTLWYSTWINVLNEYYGPLRVWITFLKRYGNDELSIDDFMLKNTYKSLKSYVYGDFSNLAQYPNKPLLLTHSFTVFSVFKVHKIIKYFPMIYRVKSVEHTNKRDYKKERFNYKLYHRVASEGFDLRTQYYQEYKELAKKYKWPFLLNGVE